jgi:hypothetical protein
VRQRGLVLSLVERAAVAGLGGCGVDQNYLTATSAVQETLGVLSGRGRVATSDLTNHVSGRGENGGVLVRFISGDEFSVGGVDSPKRSVTPANVVAKSTSGREKSASLNVITWLPPVLADSR